MNNRSDQFQEWQLEKIFDDHKLRNLLVEATKDKAFYCFLDQIEKDLESYDLYSDYYRDGDLPDVRLEVTVNTSNDALSVMASYHRVGSHDLIAAFDADTIKQQDDLSALLETSNSELSSHPEFAKMKARLAQLGRAISAQG